jgi:hypothetical protein
MEEKFRRKIEGQSAAGLYKTTIGKLWPVFRKEFETIVLAARKPRGRREILIVLRHFQRIAKPIKLDKIKTTTIDNYIAKRRKESGQKPESKVAPYTLDTFLVP